MIEYLLVAVVFAYIFYRWLTSAGVHEKRLYLYDKRSPPSMLLLVPKSPTSDEKRFITAVRRIAFELNVPLEERPVGSPFPYEFPVLLYQGKYLWATAFSRFDSEGIRRAIEEHAVRYSYYERVRRDQMKRSVVLVRPMPAALMEESHPHSVTARVVTPDAIRLNDDGSIDILDYGVPYSPYLEEQLSMIGGGVVDLRRLRPYKVVTVVESPRKVVGNG